MSRFTGSRAAFLNACLGEPCPTWFEYGFDGLEAGAAAGRDAISFTSSQRIATIATRPHAASAMACTIMDDNTWAVTAVER
jgi:hypothetical protein